MTLQNKFSGVDDEISLSHSCEYNSLLCQVKGFIFDNLLYFSKLNDHMWSKLKKDRIWKATIGT